MNDKDWRDLRRLMRSLNILFPVVIVLAEMLVIVQLFVLIETVGNDVLGAIIGAFVGLLVVSTWAIWPVIMDISRHGWNNDR